MKYKEPLLAGLIFVYVILYELAIGLRLIDMGWVNMIKNALLIAICGILVIRNWHKSLILPRYFNIFLLILFALLLIEIFTGVAADLKSPIFGFVQVLVMAKFADRKVVRYLYTSIILATLISTIPLMYSYITWGYYARDEILFDKSMQTFIFGFSYVLLAMELTQRDIGRKMLIMAALLYLMFCNVFILQSKTSVFVLLVTFALMFFLRRQETVETFKRWWKPMVVVLLILPFLPIQWEIPDAMKQAANKLTGRQMFVLSREMKEDTYTIRQAILKRTIQITYEHPVYGAGFGNQKQALLESHTGISQGESQMLDLLLDGGVTYLVAFLILTLTPIIRSIRLMRKGGRRYADEFVLYETIGFLIMCGGNEMLSSLGWLFVGSLVYISQTRQRITVFDQIVDKS